MGVWSSGGVLAVGVWSSGGVVAVEMWSSRGVVAVGVWSSGGVVTVGVWWCYVCLCCVSSPHREAISAARHMPSAPQVGGDHLGHSMPVGSDGGRYVTASRDGCVCIWKSNLVLTRTIQVMGGAGGGARGWGRTFD